jgi:hypothetical protein
MVTPVTQAPTNGEPTRIASSKTVCACRTPLLGSAGQLQELLLSAIPKRALLIAAEQVRAQYANMPTAFISNAVISLGLCFALRETVRY